MSIVFDERIRNRLLIIVTRRVLPYPTLVRVGSRGISPRADRRAASFSLYGGNSRAEMRFIRGSVRRSGGWRSVGIKSEACRRASRVFASVKLRVFRCAARGSFFKSRSALIASLPFRADGLRRTGSYHETTGSEAAAHGAAMTDGDQRHYEDPVFCVRIEKPLQRISELRMSGRIGRRRIR